MNIQILYIGQYISSAFIVKNLALQTSTYSASLVSRILTIAGNWKCKNNQKWQQQSFWKVHWDRIWAQRGHHWSKHENVFVGKIKSCFSGKAMLMLNKVHALVAYSNPFSMFLEHRQLKRETTTSFISFVPLRICQSLGHSNLVKSTFFFVQQTTIQFFCWAFIKPLVRFCWELPLHKARTGCAHCRHRWCCWTIAHKKCLYYTGYGNVHPIHQKQTFPESILLLLL